MKKMVLGLILLISSNIQAQTYSSVIKDSVIFDFLDKTIKVNYHGRSLLVNNHILGPLDTSDLKQILIAGFFSKADSDFLAQQIKGGKKENWGRPFGRNKLVKNVPPYPSSTIYSFSVPLFSSDKKHAMVIEAFFCGIVCGGGAYYIYELEADGTWKRVKKFKEWAE